MQLGRTGSAIVAALFVASAASAQVPGEEIARRAFEEGVTLEKKGDFASALLKFKESEQIKPTLGNRYHKAFCLEMTGKLATAVNEYEVVERGARDAKKADLVEAARLRLDPLRTRVPQLALHLATTTRDAEVTLDGAAVSPALLDGKAFRVDPGEHVVTARAPQHEPFEKRFAAAEGSTTSIEIALANARVAERTSTLAPPSEERRPSRTLPIVTTAGAVVFAVAGIGAFVVAGQKQDDGKDGCTRPGCDDERSATRTFDALALGSWIGAAGLAAISVVLWSSSSSNGTQARLGVRPSWVGLESRFW